MADYTLVILLVLAIMLNYLILYKKNRIISGILFISISLGAIYVSKDLSFQMFSIALLFISLLSTIYDTFLRKKGASYA